VLAFAAQHQVHQVDQVVDVARAAGRQPDVLAGAGDGGIGHVEVGDAQVGDLGGDHHLREVVHVLQPVDQAREVVDVDDGRRPVAVPLHVQGRDGVAPGAEVDPARGGFVVVRGVAAVAHEAPRHGRDHVLHQRARKAEPPVVVDPAALGQRVLLQHRQGVGHADLLQQVERGLVDARHVALGKRLVAAARKAWADHGLARPRPQCPPRAAAPDALRHVVFPFRMSVWSEGMVAPAKRGHSTFREKLNVPFPYPLNWAGAALRCPLLGAAQ
jgi:hypothetical protein